MSKQPTTKQDALRAMRESRFTSAAPITTPIEKLKEEIASIPVKKKGGRPQKKFPEYLKLLRECPCLICGKQPSESAHIRYSSAEYNKVNSGVGSKPADYFCVSLCANHHRLDQDSQHNVGDEQGRWSGHGIDPLKTAKALWE